MYVCTTIYTPPGSVGIECPVTMQIQTGEWQSAPDPRGLNPFQAQQSRRISEVAKERRDEFCKFFCITAGAVSWQWRMIEETLDSNIN